MVWSDYYSDHQLWKIRWDEEVKIVCIIKLMSFLSDDSYYWVQNRLILIGSEIGIHTHQMRKTKHPQIPQNKIKKRTENFTRKNETGYI